MTQKTLADCIIEMMLMYKKPSDFWTNHKLSFPELEQSKTFQQKNNQTVFQHTMRVLDCLALKNHITLWAALFHDLGKLTTQIIDLSNNTISFPNHDQASTLITQETLSAWNEDQYIIDRTMRIIKTHMLDLTQITAKTIRDFVGNVGKDNIENWFVVREADALSYNHNRDRTNQYIKSFRLDVEEYQALLLKKDTLDISMSSTGFEISGEE